MYFVVSLLMRRTSALFLAVLCSGAVGMAPDAGSSALPETQTAVLDEAALDALSYDFPDVPRDAVYANHDVCGHINAETLAVVDTSGAGDVMSAAIVSAMLDGHDTADCAAIGNHASGIYCAAPLAGSTPGF